MIPGERIEKLVDSVPMLPDTLYEVMDLMRRPDAEPESLARMVRRDPGLVVQTLHVCNSPYYSLPVQVASIEHAVRLLGVSTVCGIVMAAYFHVMIGRYSGEAARIWLSGARRHFLLTAECSRFLAQTLEAESGQAVSFTVGLVHDIGKLVLAQLEPEEASRVQKVLEESDYPLVEAEFQVLGIDHAELGARLAERWELPHVVVDGIANHHQPERGEYETTSLVFLANLLVKEENQRETPEEIFARFQLEPRLGDYWGLDSARFRDVMILWRENLERRHK